MNLKDSFQSSFLILAFLIFVLLTNAQDASNNFNSTDNMEYVTVSESVVMLFNNKNYGSNIVCVELNDGLVFFDCGLFQSRATKFRNDMEARFQKSTKALVLTHAHVDHFFGMAAFKDVPVISSYVSEEILEQQLQIDFLQYVEGYKSVFNKFDEALKEYELFLPTIWYENELILGSGVK